MHPSFSNDLDSVDFEKWPKVVENRFKSLKRRMVGVKTFLCDAPDISDNQRKAFIERMLSPESLDAAHEPDPYSRTQPKKSGFTTMFGKWWTNTFGLSSAPPEFSAAAEKIPFSEFLATIDDYIVFEPSLEAYASEAKEIALTQFHDIIKKQAKNLSAKAVSVAIEACRNQVNREVASQRERAEQKSREQLIQDMDTINMESS
jgi:hypothetical protein